MIGTSVREELTLSAPFISESCIKNKIKKRRVIIAGVLKIRRFFANWYIMHMLVGLFNYLMNVQNIKLDNVL